MAEASDTTRTSGARRRISQESDPAAFIAAVMAPLPETAEPANSRAFIREVGADLERPFWRQLHVCAAAQHWRLHCGALVSVAIDDGIDGHRLDILRDREQAALRSYRAEARKLLLMPAPSIYMLSEKERLDRFAGDEETRKVMSADADRLAVLRRPGTKGRRQ